MLFGDLRHEAPVGEAQIVQAALTALAALVLVLFFAIIVFGVYGAQYSASAFVYAGF